MAILADDKVEVARLFHDALNCAMALVSMAKRDYSKPVAKSERHGCSLVSELNRCVERLDDPRVDDYLSKCPKQKAALPSLRFYEVSWHHLVALAVRTIASAAADADGEDWPSVVFAVREFAPICAAEPEIKVGMRLEWLEMERIAPRNPLEERNAWMTAEWQAGHRQMGSIRREANQRWPDHTLDSDPAAHAAIDRYCERQGIEMRKGKAGRPKKPSAPR